MLQRFLLENTPDKHMEQQVARTQITATALRMSSQNLETNLSFDGLGLI